MDSAISTFEFGDRQLALRELTPTTTDAHQLLTLTNRVATEGWLGIESLAADVAEMRLFITRCLGHGAILFGLFDGDRLIGHLGIDRIADEGFSPEGSHDPSRRVTGTLVLFLAEPYRGGGLGYQLLARGCRLARVRGFHRLWAATRADNQAAISLYRKLGFRPVPSNPAGHETPAPPEAGDPLTAPGSPAILYLK